MANKITNYKMFLSSGGNTCRSCGTRMHKDLPYIAPVSGKNVIREMKGKAICISCIKEFNNNMSNISEEQSKELEKYERRRFLEHMDKEIDNV